MEQRLSFSIDKIQFIEETNKMKFAKARLWAFASGDNAHNKPVSEETLKEKAETIFDVPLVWYYDKYSDDAGGHNPLEVPCGFIPKYEANLSFEQGEDGRTWLCCDALIWKRYSGQILDLFKRDNMQKPVSVEMAVFETKPLENGKEEITDFAFTAVTILGTYVAPAIKDAKIEIMEFSADKAEYEKFNIFKIPDVVKQNVQRGLLLKRNNPKGATAVNISIANQLINNEYVSLDLINNIIKFSTNAKTETAQLLLGGIECFEWADKILNFESNEEGDNVFHGLTANQLQNRLQESLSGFKYTQGEFEYHKYNIDDFTDSYVIVYDWEENGKLYKINYTYDNGKCNLDMNSKMAIDIDYKPVGFAKKIEFSIKKDEYGTGETIKVNKSKDALSTTTWGGINKTSLRNKVLKAKNYKSLVHDAYAKVEDGWEDAPSEHLKYPIMEIKNGEAVYNEGALSSALGYAKANGENEVVSKVESIRKKLGIDSDKKDGEKMSKKVKAEKMADMCNDMKYTKDGQEMCKYSYVSHDDSYCYVLDKETEKMMAIPYSAEEEGEEVKMSIDFAKVKLAKVRMSAIADDEDNDDDVYMSMKDMFSSDVNVESAAMAKLNEKEAEYQKKLAEMETKMSEMTEKMSALEEENKKLKEEKMTRVEQKKMAQIEFTLEEVKDSVPKDKIDEYREDGQKNFSAENIDIWINKVKAEAFSFSKGKTNKSDFVKFGLPFPADDKKKSGSLWDKI